MKCWFALLACAVLLSAQRPPVEDAWKLLAQGARPQAIDLLHQIIRKNPADADARLLLGSVLADQGNREEAITQLREAVRLRPASAEAQNALGEACSRFSDGPGARAAFESAVHLDPRFAPAQENLGMMLVQAGEFAAAADHLDRAIQLMGAVPDAAYARYLRAKVYAEQGDARQAETQLKAAVALRADFGEAWSDLGQARKTLSDDAGALAAFERAVQLSPQDAVAQYRLGAQYLQQGSAHRAVGHLQEALRLDPENQSALYSLQMALREDGQVEQAAEIKRKLAVLLRRRDQTAEDALAAVQLNNQGAELEKSGHLTAALEKYRAAEHLAPGHAGIRANVAAALLRQGQWVEGMGELREALRLDPQNAAYRKALDAALARAPVAGQR